MHYVKLHGKNREDLLGYSLVDVVSINVTTHRTVV